MRLQALKERPRRRRLPPDQGKRQVAAVVPSVLDRSFEAPAPNRKWITDFTYVDSGGLALCGRRRRSLLPPCDWLVGEHSDDGPARHRRPGDGDLATGQAGRAAASFRSWQPIHQRAVPAVEGRSRRRPLDEPVRQRLDNAAMESFFSPLKTERPARKMYRTRDDAKA